MKIKFLAAVLAGGCILGLQAAAVAQDSNEHPAVATPTEAKQKPNAAAQSRDTQAAPANSEQQTGQPAPGPHNDH